MGFQFGGDHAFHDRVGNEFALVDEGLRLQAEGRSVGDFTAQQVAGGDMAQAETLDQPCGLGALAGARRAKDQIVLHGCLGVEDVNVFGIPAQLVVVESETHNEAVFDLHGHVVELEVFFVNFGLEQHRADLHLFGARVAQQGIEVGDGLARVDDVLHHDDCAALDGRSQAQHLAGDAHGKRPLVGREANA